MTPRALDNWSREEWDRECDCGDEECVECYKRMCEDHQEYLDAQGDNELMRRKEERQ